MTIRVYSINISCHVFGSILHARTTIQTIMYDIDHHGWNEWILCFKNNHVFFFVVEFSILFFFFFPKHFLSFNEEEREKSEWNILFFHICDEHQSQTMFGIIIQQQQWWGSVEHTQTNEGNKEEISIYFSRSIYPYNTIRFLIV